MELQVAVRRVLTLPSLAVCKLQGIYKFPAECFNASEHLRELSLVLASVAHDQLDMISESVKSKKIPSLEILTLSEIFDDSSVVEAMRASIDLSDLRKVFLSSVSENVVWEATKDSTGSLDTLVWSNCTR